MVNETNLTIQLVKKILRSMCAQAQRTVPVPKTKHNLRNQYGTRTASRDVKKGSNS